MVDQQESALTRRLRRAPRSWLVVYAASMAFATYFCMYGFRKAFAAGDYLGNIGLGPLGHVDTKVALLIAQVCGYCLSKFAGVKVIAELDASRRATMLVAAVVTAELALVGFALAPPSLAPLFMFLNGVPLGFTWGLVFGFVEGRRASDALGAVLCSSFIVSSGFAKTVGRLLLDHGIPERFMPACAGALFLVPSLVFVHLLGKLPPPDDDDAKSRARRPAMTADMRRRFVVRIAPGLFALVFAYVALTAYRDFRDSYARELWDALGYGATPQVMTTAELPIAVGSLFVVALVGLVEDNHRALFVVHVLMLVGAVLVGASTIFHLRGELGPAAWMICVGLGLYAGYVPFNCVLFDRLVAAMGGGGNAGFLIYVADAFGYLGSVTLLLAKTFAAPKLAWLPFFERLSLAAAACIALALGASGLYFRRVASRADGIEVEAARG